MKVLKPILVVLWKAWFFLAALLFIIILLPALWWQSRSEANYPGFFKLSRLWSRLMLFALGFKIETIITIQKLPKNYVIVANHTSMLDILFQFLLVDEPFLFIGKKELTRFPLFGFFYSKTNILVDRSSMKSRRQAFDVASKRLDSGVNVCIYPEGGVPEHNIRLGPFKDGAFKLAVDKNLPILIVVFPDNKKALPYKTFEGGPMRLRASVLPLVYPKGKSVSDLKSEVREIISKELTKYGI